MRARVFAHLAHLGPTFFEQNRSGEIMSRITADTTRITAAAGSALSQPVRNSIMLIGALTMMVFTSGRLAGLVLIVIPLTVLPLVAYGRSVRRLSRSAQDTLADAAGYAAENLSAHRTMQAYTNEATVTARYVAAIEARSTAARQRFMARAGLTALVIFLVFGGIVGVLWHGRGHGHLGRADRGQLGPIRSLRGLCRQLAGRAFGGLGRGAAGGRCGRAPGRTHGDRPAIVSPSEPLALPSRPRDVSPFAACASAIAGDRKAALRDVSFEGARRNHCYRRAFRGRQEHDPGSHIAVLRSDAGDILIDGVPLAKADLDACGGASRWCHRTSPCLPIPSPRTSAMGRLTPRLADVERAAVAAHADSFIRELPGHATRASASVA